MTAQLGVYDGRELVGYGVCEDGGIFWALADLARPDVAEAIVAWFVDVVDDPMTVELPMATTSSRRLRR